MVALFATLTFTLTSCGDDDGPEDDDVFEKVGLLKLNSKEYWVTEAYFDNTGNTIGYPKNKYYFNATLREKDSEYGDLAYEVINLSGSLFKLMSDDVLDNDPIDSWKVDDELDYHSYVYLSDEIGGGTHYIDDEGKIIIKKIE